MSSGTTETKTQSLPAWMEGPLKNSFQQATALTDINQNPYQSYGGERVAQFTPLQNQAFQTAENMQTSQAGQAGIGAAGMATMGALGTRYDPYQTGQFGAQAGSYMSPYIEQSLNPQLREAQRASEIQRNMDQARAVGQGAFGGSRQAIVEAERQRNLGMQMGDIRDRGYQAAFDRAQNQFNTEQQLREQSRQYGAGLGLQGLQTALTGAGQLGTLGGQQFAQQRDITNLQSALGLQQQQQVQQGLDTQYQDFQNRQRYPYEQLSFLAGLAKGMPASGTTSVYSPGASTGSQLLGAGTSLLGAYMMGGGKLFKEGGLASFADGGSVTDERSIEGILRKLSDAQLQQARQIALSRKDIAQLQLIDREMAERAATRSAQPPAAGIDALPAEDMDFANGGIVAFADGGDVERYQVGGVLAGTEYGIPGMATPTAPFYTQEGAPEQTPLLQRLYADFVEGARNRAVEGARARIAAGYGSDKDLEVLKSAGQRASSPPPQTRKTFVSERSQALQNLSGMDRRLLTPPSPATSGDTSPFKAVRFTSAPAAAPTPAPAPAPAPAGDRVVPTAGPSAAAEARAPQAGLAALDPLAMFKRTEKLLNDEERPEKKMLEEQTAETTKAAEADLASTKARTAKYADAYKGRRERLEGKEAELGGMKDQNLGLALLQAGAAMMSTPGGIGAALGKGIDTGSRQYIAGLDKLNAAKEKIADARDRLEELQLNRDEMSDKEIAAAEKGVRTAGLEGRERMIQFVMETQKVNRTTAATIVTQLMEIGLTQFKEDAAMQRTLIQERGQNTRAATAKGRDYTAELVDAMQRKDKDTVNRITAALEVTKGVGKPEPFTRDPMYAELSKKYAELIASAGTLPEGNKIRESQLAQARAIKTQMDTISGRQTSTSVESVGTPPPGAVRLKQ